MLRYGTILLSILVVLVAICDPNVVAFTVNHKLLPSSFHDVKASSHCLYATAGIQTSFMWNAGLNFGKGQFKFYKSFNEWMSVFPEEDRLANPETFQLPTGVYEVSLKKPLGIVFEEFDNKPGIYVKEVVTGGNAEQKAGSLQVNDVLIGITAVKVVGAKYERRLIPARKFDFDTMVGAIGSNEERFSCTDVVLLLERPSESDSKVVDNFMAFFEPPFDNPWKQRQ